MRLFRANDPTPIDATLENISGGGMFFTSSVLVLGGERLSCQIVLPLKTVPHGESALLQCELLAIRSLPEGLGYGIGCQFSSYGVHLPRRETVYWRTPSLTLNDDA
jgi:hypothetical protein